MSSSIPIPQYGRLPFFEKNKSDFIEQSIILYGESGSGKTVLIREIMYLTKDDIPNIIIISPTEESNNSYRGLVPRSCVKDSITVNELKLIYERQMEAKKTYLICNDIRKLSMIFDRCANPKEKELLRKIIFYFYKKIEEKKREMKDVVKQKTIINKLTNKKKEILIKFFKGIIHKNRKELLKMNLSEECKRIITYLYFNHRIMIIFDDYSASAQQWAKDETVKKILFQGRHEGISFVIAIHNFSLLNTDIRTNAHVSIFTTSVSANRYFTAGSNGFSKAKKIEAEKIINNLWKKNDVDNHKKLVYLRGNPEKFKYTVADIYEEFKYGSPHLWSLCEYVEKKEGINFSNLFSLPK